MSFVLPVLLVAAWFAATASGAVKPYQFASPQAVWTEFASLAASGALWANRGASIERVALGFVAALALALLLGALVGTSRTAERLIDPTLQAIRVVPSLAWVPLILLWLGIGESAKVTLIAIGAFFPIYVALSSGIRNVDRKLIDVARVHGIRGPALAARVLVPAALPQLLVGARIGLTQPWLFLVAAELLASTKGLGFLLTEGQQISRTDEILVAVLLFAICGKLSESGHAADRAATRRMDRYGRRIVSVTATGAREQRARHRRRSPSRACGRASARTPCSTASI